MKGFFKIIALLCTFVMLTASPAFAGKKDPVAVLSKAQGTVEYKKQGKKWKKVRRNKFLFDGTTIRTGDQGSGVITNKITGESYALGPNTELQVTRNAIVAKKGELKKSAASNRFVASLMKRFDKAQKFTTVRRAASVKKKGMDAARSLVLTEDYPYIVWENKNTGYEYKVTIGKKHYTVAAVDTKMVKLKVEPFTGTQTYRIDAYKNGKRVIAMKPYKKRGKAMHRTVTWMSSGNQKNLNQSIAILQREYPENQFMLGNYLEEQKLFVAAMDQYRAYLQNNPDEIEMTPYLFRVYKSLRLNTIRKEELEEYKTQLLQ